MSAEVFDQQRQLYGEPIHDVVRRIGSSLGLSQGAVARVIGMSPAMLSQLASGQRTKIGNPIVLGRLRALAELAADGPGSAGDLAARLEAIAGSEKTAGTLTVHTSAAAATPDTDGSEVVRRVLQAVASPDELDAAVAALVDVAPRIAEVLRVYGTGSAGEASAHYRALIASS